MVRPPKRIAISNAGLGSRLPSCSPLICKLKGRTDRVREPQVCEKSTLTDAHEFPVGATKIPVLRNLFPVNLIRELAPKCRGNGVSGSRGRFPNPKITVFPVKFPVSREFTWETGSYPTACATIQSPRTADFQAGSKRAVSVGIFAGIVPLFPSLETLAVSQPDFGLPSLHPKIPFPAAGC